MSVDKIELEKEKEYLLLTVDIIKELIKEKDLNIENQANAVNELKKYIWENIGVLDDIEVIQEMSNVNDNISVANSNIEILQKLKKSLINPYFGRIDFVCDDDIKKIYIGINGVNKKFTHYVYDWRTPIASLFYNSDVGLASYEAPAGIINGEIKLKRQYKILEGKLIRCFNSSINIDDDYLQEILANSSSDKMTNIVSTIQQEQNEIIRNINDKFLIVQGIAGSGKTSVALHRIAYLLYAQKNLTSSNVLIFSPNDVFSSYISNVLPELGENNVLQTTFSDFARSYLREYKSIESFTEFIERYYKHKFQNVKEYNEIKYKLSDEFENEISEYLKIFEQDISFRKGIIINNKELTKENLTDIFVNKYNRIPLVNRIEKLAEYICDFYNISYKKYYKKIKERLLNSMNVDLNARSVYINMLKENLHEKKTGYHYDQTLEVSKNLKYDDLIPMLYIYFEINGYPYGDTIKHIIIDEAQDYTMLQFKMLKKIFRSASFTILGDINQTINPYYKYSSLNSLNVLFEEKGKFVELNKTYRSSQEIIEYTNKILGLSNSCSIRRANKNPVILKDVDSINIVDELVEDINMMKHNGMKKISIITKSNDEAAKIYNKLKEIHKDIVIIDNNSDQKIGDIVVLPSYISKGLEFDSVIACVDKDNLYTEDEKNLFYVVCTRAQHNLAVYNQKIMEKTK